jgi:hypothetical protein
VRRALAIRESPKSFHVSAAMADAQARYASTLLRHLRENGSFDCLSPVYHAKSERAF